MNHLSAEPLRPPTCSYRGRRSTGCARRASRRPPDTHWAADASSPCSAIILAADTARFGQPKVDLGVIPGIGSTQRLPRAIGKYKATELVLTGLTMGAEETEHPGLVSRIAPADRMLEEAAAVAETIAAKPLPVIYAAKAALQAAQETSREERLCFEKQAYASTFALEESERGHGGIP